ncbi:MAG: HAD hydrolase-like protein, partial [Bacillales bacterium]|nr:HAD hydrolase-like protein [Bacillales bacterium]
QEGVPIKPDPTSLNNLILSLGVNKDEVLYVGDSDSDMMVANNAKVKKVGVTYGYRKKEEIEKYHPDYFIDDFEEIIQVIERIK